MGRAEIQGEINSINESISSLTSELDKLVEIKNSLSAFLTTISYVLVDDENIKSGYNLAGTKYSEETASEQDFLKNLKRDFNTKIDNVSEKVSKKIQELEEERGNLSARRFVLSLELLAARE